MAVATAVIPNRPVFRAQEVCDLAEVQPYVLRSWEAEFPDLGVAKTANGPRVYRRADVERVLRIKHLLFVDGLTLAGARRRIAEDGIGPSDDVVQDADVAALIDGETLQQLRDVRRGLQWILGVLGGDGAAAEEFVLRPPRGASAPRSSATRNSGRKAVGKRKTKPVKPAKGKKAAKGGKKR